MTLGQHSYFLDFSWHMSIHVFLFAVLPFLDVFSWFSVWGHMKSKQLLYIIKGFENARGFPGGSDSEDSACRLIEHCRFDPQGRSPGEGHGYPLQYSCLGNPIDRGAWWPTVHGVKKSQTRLSNWHLHLKVLARFGWLLVDCYTPCFKFFCSGRELRSQMKSLALSCLTHPWACGGYQKCIRTSPTWSGFSTWCLGPWPLRGSALQESRAANTLFHPLPSHSPGEALLQKSFGVCAGFPCEGIRN